MNIFQKAADWIQSWKMPKAIKKLLGEIQVLMWNIAKDLTEEQINFLTSEAVRQSKLDIPGTKKLQNVIKSFTLNFDISVIGKRLTLFINALVVKLTEDKHIDPKRKK